MDGWMVGRMGGYMEGMGWMGRMGLVALVDGTGLDGMGWDGMGWNMVDGAGRDGME